MDTIAVLIPCYNESATIEKVVHDFRAALPEAVIYVYDNNSTDGTADIARKAGAVVRFEKRQGKGNVIRSMFRDIEARCYLMADGDDTYPAEHARDMVRLVLEEGADMVVGDRLSATYFSENKRPFHNVGNTTVRKLVNLFFKGDIKDIMTGYRAFSPGFVKSFPVLSRGFEIETEMSIHALDHNLCLMSLPIQYRDRPEGSESKLNTVSDGMTGFILLLPVFLEYFQTGLVPRFPTLFFGCFLMLSAFCSLICGLILDTQATHHKQDAEVRRNMIAMLLHNKE